MAIKMYQGTDNQFKSKCELANVKPTKRQYKKYQNGKGSAYKVK